YSSDALPDIQREVRKSSTRVQNSAEWTKSLLSKPPSMRAPTPIFDRELGGNDGSLDKAFSLIAPSDLEFEFDNVVLNGQVYRRAFAKTELTRTTKSTTHVEGDLLDFSETTTAMQAEITGLGVSGAIHDDLRGLTFQPASPLEDVAQRLTKIEDHHEMGGSDEVNEVELMLFSQSSSPPEVASATCLKPSAGP
ncbi:hypothetical protein B0T10DRAFT_575249, partial [Thelonectria olida]